MTSQEMMKHPSLNAGYVFVNAAPLGESPNWIVKLDTPQESHFLFGYEPHDLLAKQ